MATCEMCRLRFAGKLTPIPDTLGDSFKYTIPANGLQAISQNISNLTSLKCYSVDFLNNNTNMFHIAHCFPNLQMLDLSCCFNVPAEGIGHVLNTCCNIRHLNLKLCCGVKLHGMNFKAPKLEVLNLSYTRVDDETLYMISKSCRQILQLYLRHCYCVTEKGVKHVVENCTQLREVDLRDCIGVHAHVVESMVSSRPSLRKIIAPPGFRFNERNKKLFLHHGCLVYF
ncbi:F-box/LRR-repeat protein 4-like [Trifolium pratense]|uniref:F-box/LRR-repeat protein 4-like n=1 Tax=Trifolium pratense TaxID=57577 RepID=UPI001E694043|nr:F-box/LRR-repeat protein 4-like [Trifolium pratense]